MYRVLRPLLFRLEPERAHELTIKLLQLAGTVRPARWLLSRSFTGPDDPIEVCGIQFKNRVGLAAGYDKDGLGWRGLAELGFGHLELGTVTLQPQPGNSKPRVFRLLEDRAVINRMGFPGRGAEFLRLQLIGQRHPGLVVGVNIGKNKDTPLDQAVVDYIALMKVFAPHSDYLAVNVSSPNTIGLRRLQARDTLFSLLTSLEQERRVQEAALNKKIPVFVKLAPDLTEQELEDALDAIIGTNMSGVIATNTTIARDGLTSDLAGEAGGLSGSPLAHISTQRIRTIYRLTQGKLPIIGVGGIMDTVSARQKLDAGAVLVQLYTGLVYAGPGLVKQILQSIKGF